MEFRRHDVKPPTMSWTRGNDVNHVIGPGIVDVLTVFVLFSDHLSEEDVDLSSAQARKGNPGCSENTVDTVAYVSCGVGYYIFIKQSVQQQVRNMHHMATNITSQYLSNHNNKNTMIITT